ncbi:nucleoside triphosphate pyrophosphohydrolase ham1 [Lecanora helva]
MPHPLTLHFITSNPHKLHEVRAILDDVPGLTLTNQSLDLTEIQGKIEEVSRDKCRRAAEVELPGPYIKWFLQALGHEGLNNLLLAYEDKSAQAVCTFAYCEGPGHEGELLIWNTQGKIVPARGPTDFGEFRDGWDPIFEYEGQTYAEMDKAKKNAISHRALALAKLKSWLQSQTQS